MKGFYWGTGRVRCGFCGISGHNITTCPSVSIIAKRTLQNIESDPSYVCTPVELRALNELKAREQRKEKLKKAKRRKPRCSFCGSVDHKRPKCAPLKKFKKQVYQANKNWKRLFVKRINETGLGVGCLIKFDEAMVYNYDFNINPHMIGMITSYDISKINVFCALSEYTTYQSDALMQVSSGDRADNINIRYLSPTLGCDLLYDGWWYSQSRAEVVSPMGWNPPDEWMNSEWDEVFDWFFKKVNYNELEKSGLISFINKWSNKSVLFS